MRVFVAALITDSTKRDISDYINSIKGSISGVKWEKPEKLHITLKFLGTVESELSEKIVKELFGELKNTESFSLDFDELDVFPNMRKPRVLVLKLVNSAEIQCLHKEVEKACSKYGFDTETRKFKPHITIGRIKGRFKLSDIAGEPVFEPLKISKIAVVESRIDSEGSTYRNLAEFDL